MPMSTDHLRASGFTDYTSDRLDNLLGGSEETFADKETLVTGQNLRRGAALGRITASGKLTLATAAAGDGSNAVVGILAEDTDATAADKECMVYKAGTFNENAVILGAGIVLDRPTKHALRGLDLYFRKNVPAV